VLESRGISREIGIAAWIEGYARPSLYVWAVFSHLLTQIADCQIYVKSLHQMHIHNPSLVLISDTFLSAALAVGEISASTYLYISDEFPGVQIDAVGCRYWNDAGGKLSWTYL